MSQRKQSLVDIPTRNKLVEENYRLVCRTTLDYHSRHSVIRNHLEIEDAIQIACIAMLRAVELYNSENNIKGRMSTTYLVKCIKYHLLRAANNNRLVHIPIHTIDRICKKKEQVPESQSFTILPEHIKSQFAYPKNNHIALEIESCLSVLEPEEQKLLELRFGLKGNQEYTMAMLVKEFQSTHWMIHRRIKKALEKIRVSCE